MAQDANLQIRAIRENAHSTIGSRYDYDSLVELAGNSRFALLVKPRTERTISIKRAR